MAGPATSRVAQAAPEAIVGWRTGPRAGGGRPATRDLGSGWAATRAVAATNSEHNSATLPHARAAVSEVVPQSALRFLGSCVALETVLDGGKPNAEGLGKRIPSTPYLRGRRSERVGSPASVRSPAPLSLGTAFPMTCPTSPALTPPATPATPPAPPLPIPHPRSSICPPDRDPTPLP